MAKATLLTNYQDDVLASSMGGKRRFRKIENSDGTISLEDVTDYTQVGSSFGAANINATNTAINAAADASKILTTLDDVLACTQTGYMVDARVIKAMVEG